MRFSSVKRKRTIPTTDLFFHCAVCLGQRRAPFLSAVMHGRGGQTGNEEKGQKSTFSTRTDGKKETAKITISHTGAPNHSREPTA